MAMPGPLDVLETGDAATSLRELLSWSHRQLSPPVAQMFALVGVHCGPDISVPAAASLAGVPAGAALRALAELADVSLIAEHRPGRYVMHDIVRGYAAWHARHALGEAGIRAAVGRSLDHYLHTMIISSDTPRPYTPVPPAPGVAPERLADERRVDWARAEHQVLLQAIAQAAAAGLLTRAWQIFECQSWHVVGEGYWAEAAILAEQALPLFRQIGDHALEIWALYTLGECHAHLGNYGPARSFAKQTFDASTKAGDLTSLAIGWSVMGLAHSRAGEHREAIRCYGRALPYARQWKTALSRRFLADILADVGDAYVAAGDPSAGRQAWHEALQILDDLRLPDSHGIRGMLEQAGLADAPA